MKADLIRRGWRLEKTHDLQKLCDYLAGYDGNLADTLQPVVDALAESYVESRYPGFDFDEPDWPKLRGQMEQVNEYSRMVLKELEGR